MMTIMTFAVVLSGGAGSRLGGLDKGLIKYQSKPLIEHVTAALSPQVDNILVCANRNIEQYEALGFIVLRDECDDFQGPLSGICSALKSVITKSSAEQILVSSCDVPHLPLNLKTQLQLGLDTTPDADVAIVHDGNRRQNLHCLIKRRAWPSLIDFFESGGRAMHRWFAQVNCVDVDFSDQADCFKNINTSTELKI